MADGALGSLIAEIRACRACDLPHEPRPVIRAEASARVLVAGQAPGVRVHKSGVPFDDPSGIRLRHWMGVGPETFYDAARVAIVPVGFCFPGHDAKGGDLPPRKECAPLWRERVLKRLPAIRMTLLVGSYAQDWSLGRAPLTARVAAWRDHAPEVWPLPHPSWRNNAWLKRHPWFEVELLPALRARLAEVLA